MPEIRLCCWITHTGSGALPPMAKVNTVPGFTSVRRVRMPNTPPQPTAMDTYCLPSTT